MVSIFRRSRVVTITSADIHDAAVSPGELKRDDLVRRVLSHPAYLLACGFGSGLAPVAPGTVGTGCAVLVYLGLQHLPFGLYLVVVALAFVSGIRLCQVTARALDVHDHPAIVWDEFVGYWITMSFAPPGWSWMVIGFLAFRLFDIWKPWPICSIDRRVAGGLGIMLDDALAGLFAGITVLGIALLGR